MIDGWKEDAGLRMLDLALAPSLLERRRTNAPTSSLCCSATRGVCSRLTPAESHQFLHFSCRMAQAPGTYFVTATVCLAAIRVSQKER